jgi:hypothetical protein
MREVINLAKAPVESAVEAVKEIAHPKMPKTPSLKWTNPKFVAGIQMSRTSMMNWNRMAPRVLLIEGQRFAQE